MPAITACLNYMDAARRRFPRTPASRIRGSGWFALVSKCTMPWTVNLYQTKEERAATLERWSCNKCMASNCGYSHETVDL